MASQATTQSELGYIFLIASLTLSYAAPNSLLCGVRLNEVLDSFVCPSYHFASVLALKAPHGEVASTHVLKVVDE